MALTPDDLDRLARLARLDLPADRRSELLHQLNGFFDLAQRLQAVDTTGIAPLAHPVDAVEPVALRLADDQVTEQDQREANQRSAPAVERGLFLVPRVIE